MKKYNKKTLATGMLLGAVIAVSGVTFAANDTNTDMRNEMNFHNGYQKVQNQEARDAVEAGNYTAFKAAVGDKRAEKITEERFEKIVAIHKAREIGDIDTLKKLRGEMKSWRQEHREERKSHRADIKSAVESGDYQKFSELTKGREKQISEEVFGKIKNLHKAREDGNNEEVKKIRMELKELGFSKRGHGRGMER